MRFHFIAIVPAVLTRLSELLNHIMNEYRKLVTSGLGFTFMVVGITGIVFKFFIKNHALEQVHVWLGLAMFVLAMIHIVQNWTQLQNYFRDWRVFTLLVPIVLVTAFFFFGKTGTDRGANPRAIMHKLSHANANDIARVFGKDVNNVFLSMKADGLRVRGADETIQELANQNQKPPDRILVYFVQ